MVILNCKSIEHRNSIIGYLNEITYNTHIKNNLNIFEIERGLGIMYDRDALELCAGECKNGFESEACFLSIIFKDIVKNLINEVNKLELELNELDIDSIKYARISC